MAGWIDGAIWWHVYPLGFTGAEPAFATEAGKVFEVHHRLPHLANWLDYAVELGATGIALGPIFASSTHGYDTIDYFRIDSRLGDDRDFDAFVAAAKARGLRVLLDGVFSHCGRAFPAFRQALVEGQDSEENALFRIDWNSPRPPGSEPAYECFEGYSQLVRFDHAEPRVAEHVISVMKHWLARGADGWRLDAAYAVPPAFWARVLPSVREAYPEAYFAGEVIHGDYAAIVRESGMDAVTQYELWKAIWSSLNARNFFELAWALERHNGFLERFVPLTFVGNHDVTRLASALTEERHIAHANAILFACGGTPSIYAGDEHAFRGIKEQRAGGDDAIRPRFPASPSELAPYGRGTFELHRRLIALRREQPWLHAARTRTVHLTNHQFTFETRADEGRMLVALNIDSEESLQPAPYARHALAGNGAIVEAGAQAAHVRLPPHGWALLAV